MSTVVSLYNLRTTGFAHRQFSRIPALGTLSRTLKQVDADDDSVNYARLAPFGVAVAENGALRAGNTVVTNTYTVLTTDYNIIIDLAGVNKTITLPVSGGLTDGRKMWVVLRSSSGGIATLAAGAGDTILGGASVSMGATPGAAAAIRRIYLDLANKDWLVQP